MTDDEFLATINHDRKRFGWSDEYYDRKLNQYRLRCQRSTAITDSEFRRIRDKLGLSDRQLSTQLGCTEPYVRQMAAAPDLSSHRQCKGPYAKLMQLFDRRFKRPADWPRQGRRGVSGPVPAVGNRRLDNPLHVGVGGHTGGAPAGDPG